MNDDSDYSGVVFFVLICSAVLFGVAGWVIGQSKGASGLGAFLGALLGPIGLVITAFMRGDRQNCRFCNELMSPSAEVCPHCQKSLFIESPQAYAPIAIPVPTVRPVPSPRIAKNQGAAPLYFICRPSSGEVLGPYKRSDIDNLRLMKIVDEETLFCREGQEEWIKNLA
jgi:hypothetical protein